MDKEWIELANLQKVNNLVTEKEYINEIKKMWEDIFREYKIDYKFDIVVDTEYSTLGVRKTCYLKKVYILKVYTTKEYFSQAKRIINEYMAQEIETIEQVEDDEKENYEPKAIRLSNIFFIAVLLIAIVFEIGLIVSTKNKENGMVEYTIMGILITMEVYGIIRLLKK